MISRKDCFDIWILSFRTMCSLFWQQKYWGNLLSLSALVVKIMGTKLYKSVKIPSKTSLEILGGSCFLNISFIIFSWISFWWINNFNKKPFQWLSIMSVSLLFVYLLSITTSPLQISSTRFSIFSKCSSRLADLSVKSSSGHE